MVKAVLPPHLLNESGWIQWSVPTRIVWITLIAMADKNCEVDAHINAVAHYAHVSLEETKEAIKTMVKPDPHSRFAEYEGRTLEITPRGWRLLQLKNYWRP